MRFRSVTERILNGRNNSGVLSSSLNGVPAVIGSGAKVEDEGFDSAILDRNMNW